jgi:hypothetical protein
MMKPNPNWENKNKPKEQFEQQWWSHAYSKTFNSNMYGSEKLP